MRCLGGVMLHSVRRWIAGTVLPGAIAITGAALCGLGQANAAKPVEYVKICSLYGAGFYYIPGTDTCIKVGGWLRADYGWGQSNFATTPDFNVTGSGGFIGVGGNVLFGVPGTNLSFGPSVGVYLGNQSGSTFYAPSGGTYTPRTGSIATYDLMANIRVDQAWGMFATVGGASVRTSVSGTGPGFDAKDSNTTWGWAVGGGVKIHLPNMPIDMTVQFTHIDVPTTNYNIPGMVPVKGNINLFGVGAEYSFTPSSR